MRKQDGEHRVPHNKMPCMPTRVLQLAWQAGKESIRGTCEECAGNALQSSGGVASRVRTGKKACCFLLAVLRVDRPHCMDHPARRQVKAPAAHQLCRCAV